MRSVRRRTTIVACASAALLVGAVAAYAVAGVDDEDDDPGLPLISTADRAAYRMKGAWAIDDQVHVGDHVTTVAGADTLAYTSVGALAWSSTTHDTTLVMPDGSAHALDYPGLREQSGVPGSDPDSPYIAYVRTAGTSDRAEVVVVDLTSGQQQVVDGPRPDLTSAARPAVSISGDLVIYPTADDAHHQVNWHTGDQVPFDPADPVPDPALAGGHYARLLFVPGVVTRAISRPGVTRWQIRSTTDDSILLDTAGEMPPDEAAALLSPDGDHLLVTTGTGVAVVSVGDSSSLRIDGESDVSGYGWSPNGHLISTRSAIGDGPPESATLVRGVPVHVAATPD